MISKMFTVYDSVASLYSSPFMAANVPAACRSFADSLSRPDSMYHKHEADYSLWEVGTFDDNTCSFVLLPRPQRVFDGVEFLASRQEKKS